jgi:hypothetical protein
LGLVEAVGAAAGLAAGAGLPLLVVLHLSQARDVKRLREWAGRAPERSVPRRSTPWHRRAGTRAVAVGCIGLLVLGGATYGVTQVTGDDGSHSAKASNAQALPPPRPKRKSPAVEPENVTVAVLNATTVPGLAASLSNEIAAAGFSQGTIDNFSDQQLPASVVQYAPGHEAEAKAVGRTVGISRREPVAAGSRALAPDATVIVIAGADKAP